MKYRTAPKLNDLSAAARKLLPIRNPLFFLMGMQQSEGSRLRILTTGKALVFATNQQRWSALYSCDSEPNLVYRPGRGDPAIHFIAVRERAFSTLLEPPFRQAVRGAMRWQ